MITAGSDCEVRLWSLHERDDVLESFSVEESPYSLAASVSDPSHAHHH